MLISENLIVKNANKDVKTKGINEANWLMAKTENKKPIPINPTSLNSHKPSVALDFKLSG